MYCLKIEVIGNVQGVYFRKNTKEKADDLSLTGWVKNINKNMVIVCAEGSMENLISLSTWCQKGPENSTIEKINIEWQQKEKNEFLTFDIYK